jgi:hypothetical protein
MLRAMLGTSIPAAAARRDAHYLQATLAITATVFLGFYFTYFAPILSGAYPAVSPAVHVHGWTFFVWYLLLPLQAFLAHSRRLPLHRTLGTASLILATLMIVTGTIVIGAQMEIARTSAEPTFFGFFGPTIFATLALFAGFYAAALVNRRRAPYHRRYLIVASAAGMGAATFRILSVAFGQTLWVAPVGVLATNLFIIWGMIHDRRKDGRVHPSYLLGLPVCVAVETLTILMTPTVAGHALAGGLAWFGRVSSFLY